MGGGRHANCSVLEAITLCEKAAGRAMKIAYKDENRSGDHIWWVSDTRKFQAHYPGWSYRYSLEETIGQIIDAMRERHTCV